MDEEVSHDPYLSDGASISSGGRGWSTLKDVSGCSKCALAYILASFLLACLIDPVIGFLFLASLLLSSVPLYLWWKRHAARCPLDLVIRSFFSGFAPLFFVVIFSLLFVGFPILNTLCWALFPKQAVPIVTITSQVVALVGFEEVGKVLWARRSRAGVELNRFTIADQIGYTATSVGYATASANLWTWVSFRVIEAVFGVNHDSAADLGLGVVALLICSLLGTPLHVLSGYLIGLNTSSQASFGRVGLYSFCARLVFVLICIVGTVLLAVTAGHGVVGVVFSLSFMAACFWALCVVFLRHIKSVEASMPPEYLRSVGYLNVAGYGLLPGAETAESIELPQNMSNLV